MAAKNLQEFPIPKNEEKRIKILDECNIFQSSPTDEAYDRYTNMAARIFKTPVALVSLTDVNRQWFKSKVGTTSCDLPRKDAFCSYAILEESPPVLLILDTKKDSRFCENPLVVNEPSIRFYAGASLIVDGVKIGTFCIFDYKERNENNFGEKEIAILLDLSSAVANLIQQQRDEHLTNIYRTLSLNADLLRLFQVPLQHICESKNLIQSYYNEVKQHLNTSNKNKDSKQRMISLQKLENEVIRFTQEVNRLLPISLTMTSLLTEIYHLQYYEALELGDIVSDIIPTELVSILGDESSYFSSLTKCNVEKLEASLEQYSQNSSTSVIPSSLSSDTSTVKITWPQRTDTIFSNNSIIYSYPTLIEYVLMVLYDLYDYHSIPVVMKITFKMKEQIVEMVHSGKCIISVEAKDDPYLHMEGLPNIFNLMNKISNCSYKLNCSSSSSSSSKYEFQIFIPYYTFQTDLPVSWKLKVKVGFEEENLKLNVPIKLKPSNKLSSNNHSTFYSTFHSLQIKWKEYCTYSKAKLNKVVPDTTTRNNRDT